jgi:hypothetical protein
MSEAWRNLPYTELRLSGRANSAISGLQKSIGRPVTIGLLADADEYWISQYKGFGMLTRREIKLVIDEFIRRFGNKEPVNEVPAELTSVEKAWGAQAEKADRKSAESELEQATASPKITDVRVGPQPYPEKEPEEQVRYIGGEGRSTRVGLLGTDHLWLWFSRNQAIVEDLVTGTAAIFYPTQQQLIDALRKSEAEAKAAERPITSEDPVVALTPPTEPEGKAEPAVNWMTVRKAAEHLGLSIAGVRKRAKEGRMPTRKEGPNKFDRLLVGVPA